MSDAMAFARRLSGEIADLRARIQVLQSSSLLTNAAIDDGAVRVKDREGRLVGVIGKQGDGSYGSIVRNSPPQGRPTEPVLLAGDLGAVEVTWDGGVIFGRVHEIHGHVEVYAAHQSGESAPSPEDGHRAGTIRDREGGATTIVCPTPGTWYVWLRMVGADRVTRGDFSEPSTVEIVELVDTEAIREELDAARDRLDQAEAEWEQTRQQLEDGLADLNENVLPALDAELAGARDDIEAAQVRLDAAEQNITASQDRLDTLENDTLPGLNDAISQGLAEADQIIHRLAIADTNNKNHDPEFEGFYQPGMTAPDRPGWYSILADRWVVGTWSGGDPHKAVIRLASEYVSSGPHTLYYGGHQLANRWVKCTPGEQLRVRWQVERPSGASDSDPYDFAVSYQDDAQNGVAWDDGHSWADVADGEWAEVITTVPAGAAIMAFRWQGGNAAASRGIANVHITRMNNGQLTVDGSILARHIVAESIAGAVAEFLELHANQITAGTIDTARLNVSDLAAQIATIIELNADRIIAGQLGADRIDVNDLFADTVFTNELAAAVVNALEVTAETGFIGGALLKDNTIDVAKINVTEQLVAEVAQILHLVADQVEMNTFIAMSGMVGHLEAIGMTLSDEASGQRTEVSGRGIEVIDIATDAPQVQIGNFGDDLMTMYDRETGEPTIALSGAGGISAMHLYTGGDIEVGGKPLAGEGFEAAPWNAASSVLGSVGMGAPRVLIRPFTTGPTVSGPRAIAHIEAKVEPGRSYRIHCSDFRMGNRQDYYMQAYSTTSTDPNVRPTTPTSSSPTMGRVPCRNPISTSSGAFSVLSYDKVFCPATSYWVRIIFVVGRYDGGTLTFGDGGGMGSSPRFHIEDLGPRVGDGGMTVWRDPTDDSAIGEAADMLTQEYTISQTATYTWNVSTGTATRQGIDVEPRFGRWPNGVYYLTLVQFNSWSQGGDFHNLDCRVRVDRWATSSGHALQSGIVNMTGTPPTSFNAPSARTAIPNLTGVGVGTSVRLPWTSTHGRLQAQQTRGAILLGWDAWAGSSSNSAAAGVLRTTGTRMRLSTTTATND